jgi:hypothetical protein
VHAKATRHAIEAELEAARIKVCTDVDVVDPFFQEMDRPLQEVASLVVSGIAAGVDTNLKK